MDQVTDAEEKVVEGLCCARCQAARVAALPANGITPKPGYRCLACGARMRGTTGVYLVVVVLGFSLLLVAAGCLAPFKDQIASDNITDLVRTPLGPGTTFIAIPLYLFLTGFSLRELARPRPRRG